MTTQRKEYIRSSYIGKSKSGYTSVWALTTINGKTELGLVKWYFQWRCYCFFPEPNTLFDRQCLRDIAEFCEEKTLEHRGAK